jgi:hypothetical protein
MSKSLAVMGEVAEVQRTRITCFQHFPTGGIAVLSDILNIIIIYNRKYGHDTLCYWFFVFFSL